MAIIYTEIWSPMLNAIDPDQIQGEVEGENIIAFIPNDMGNKHWREYQDWLALGNKPNPSPDVPPPLKSAR